MFEQKEEIEEDGRQAIQEVKDEFETDQKLYKSFKVDLYRSEVKESGKGTMVKWNLNSKDEVIKFVEKIADLHLYRLVIHEETTE